MLLISCVLYTIPVRNPNTLIFLQVLGILEYDPSLSEPAGHRQFIRDRAQFKECIPFTNPTLLDKIHQTYRVQYIQVSETPSLTL